MTQYPNSAAPYVAPNPRPTAVTVLAVVGIVWGVLMLLCNGMGLIPAIVPSIGAGNPAFEEIRAHPLAGPWSVIGPIIGVALAVVLLAACAGALGLKPWGRSLMNVFALAEIFVVLFDAFVRLSIVNPITIRALASMPGGAGAPAVQSLQLPLTLLGVVITLALPVCILLFMNRPHVKAAFAGETTPGGIGGYPPPQAYPGTPGAYPPPPPPQAPPPGQYPPQGPYSQ
jgi:hypothetical protein